MIPLSLTLMLDFGDYVITVLEWSELGKILSHCQRALDQIVHESIRFSFKNTCWHCNEGNICNTGALKKNFTLIIPYELWLDNAYLKSNTKKLKMTTYILHARIVALLICSLFTFFMMNYKKTKENPNKRKSHLSWCIIMGPQK